MRKLAALIVLVASAAWAGEVLLGVIVVTDGGTGSNRTAGAAAAAPTTFLDRTKCNAGFAVNSLDKVTIQTDEGCYVATDVSGCDAGMCLLLAANEKFPTSINTSKTFTAYAYNWDGGSQAVSATCAVTYTGGWISVAPPVGGAACHAKVFYRTGKE